MFGDVLYNQYNYSNVSVYTVNAICKLLAYLQSVRSYHWTVVSCRALVSGLPIRVIATSKHEMMKR